MLIARCLYIHNGTNATVTPHIFGSFDHIDDADPESYGVTAPLNKSVVVGAALSF